MKPPASRRASGVINGALVGPGGGEIGRRGGAGAPGGDEEQRGGGEPGAVPPPVGVRFTSAQREGGAEDDERSSGGEDRRGGDSADMRISVVDGRIMSFRCVLEDMSFGESEGGRAAEHVGGEGGEGEGADREEEEGGEVEDEAEAEPEARGEEGAGERLEVRRGRERAAGAERGEQGDRGGEEAEGERALVGDRARSRGEGARGERPGGEGGGEQEPGGRGGVAGSPAQGWDPGHGAGAQPQAEEQEREEALPPEHAPGGQAKGPGAELEGERVPVEARVSIEVEGEAEGVAALPGGAGLGPAVDEVREGELGDEEGLRPGGDRWVAGDRGAARPSGGRVGGAQAAALSPAVEAVGAAAVGEEQDKMEAEEDLLASPVSVAAAEQAGEQEPAQHGGEARSPAEGHRADGEGERAEVEADLRGAVVEEQERPAAADQIMDEAGEVDEAVGLADAVAVAGEGLGAVDELRGGGGEQALVGEEVVGERGDLEQIDEQAEAEEDAEERERARVDLAEEHAAKGGAVEDDERDEQGREQEGGEGEPRIRSRRGGERGAHGPRAYRGAAGVWRERPGAAR
jgi:hypothetical protein